MSELEKEGYKFAAGIITAVIVAYLTWLYNKRTRRIAACTNFRAAIINELGSIYPNPSAWPHDISGFLKSKFMNLQFAVTTFRPYVKDKTVFDAAWLRYYCAYPNKTKEQIYHHYLSSFDPLIGNQDMAGQKARSEFHKNVSSLLSCAGET